MSSRVQQTELDRAFERLTRMADKLQPSAVRPDQWSLYQPEGADGNGREPWAILNENSARVATLGYTRRDALSSLMSMCAILAVVLGA